MEVSFRPSNGNRPSTAAVVSFAGGWRTGVSTALALFCWLSLAPAVLAQSSPEIFSEIAAPNLSAEDHAAELQGPSVVRSRYVAVDVQQILGPAVAAHPRPARARGESPKRLTFNLFADAVQEFEEDHSAYSADGHSFAWYGRPTGSAGGQALLVVTDGRVAGSVRTASGEFYRIRSVSPDVQVIRQVSYQGTPPMPDAVPVPDSEVPQAAKAQQASPAAASATLDVLVVYTAGARQAAGGTSAIQNEIQLAIAELNQSFGNSGIDLQARLVHSDEIVYNNEQTDLSTSLARLRATNDGYMDDVHALRDQYGADVVALLVNGPGSGGGTVGTGYIMQTVGSYFSAYAFSVTEVNFATGPAYALLHEIGHNLGCAHDRANASSAGAYSYSYGYQRATSPRFRTIMSYNCSGVNCPTIDYWSNPNVSYSGYSTGISSNASNSADNRQTLNNTKATAAAWRDSRQRRRERRQRWRRLGQRGSHGGERVACVGKRFLKNLQLHFLRWQRLRRRAGRADAHQQCASRQRRLLSLLLAGGQQSLSDERCRLGVAGLGRAGLGGDLAEQPVHRRWQRLVGLGRGQ